MNKLGFLLAITLIITTSGCNQQPPVTDQQKVREALQKNALQSRFTKVDLSYVGELYTDNLDKRMWVRFANTEQVVEVKYSVDDVVIPAEANEGTGR